MFRFRKNSIFNGISYGINRNVFYMVPVKTAEFP